jgi:ABC-2 type transport system permease protein
MRTVWLVARWEFMTTVTRSGFLLALVMLPVAHLLLAGLLGFSLRSTTRGSAKPVAVMIVDQASALPGGESITTNGDQAFVNLREGSLDAVVVLSEDYLQSGRVRIYSQPMRGFIDLGNRLRYTERAAAIVQSSVTAGRLTPAEQQRVVRPIQAVDAYRVSAHGFEAESLFAGVTALTGPFGVCFLLGLSIFLASGGLYNATTAEVSNRMLEMMLCIVRPVELLAGKVAGLAAAGLLQVAAYVAIAVFSMQMLPGAIGLPLTIALWSIAFFVAGYAMFAVLLAATGVLAREPADGMNLASLWMMVSAVPFFFVLQFDGRPAAGMVALLSWLPLTAPAAMLLRLGVGGLGVTERILVLGLIAGTGVGALVLTARLFSNRVVHGRATLVRPR